MSATAIDAINEFAQDTGVYAFMNTAWAWPAIESLHFVGLSLLIGTVGLFDLRVLNIIKSISISALHALVPWGVLGFFINVITGAMFFVSAPDQYLYNPAFQLKVLCLAVAGLNIVLFYGTRLVGCMRAMRPEQEALPLLKIVAATSLASWIGVITFGRLITFYRPPEHWCFWC